MEPLEQKLQSALIEMLAWFHQFCSEHQLKYYVLGGTMLGAVRHKGFIPWDDDIDIGMPREDFRRMEQLMIQYPNKQYLLETPNSEKSDFFYCFAKLYDLRTTLVENTRIPVKRGIYLDIFALDGAGDTREESIAYFKPIKRRSRLLLAMTTGVRSGRKFYKNVAILLMRCIPRWLIDPKKLLADIQCRCSQKSFYQCAWVANFSGAYGEREIMPREVFGDPVEYPFEKMSVYGVRDYETYLTTLYGDWRKLPPVEQQRTHHDFLYCDLHKSYLEE